MKRFVSLALVLALLWALCLPAALAEEGEEAPQADAEVAVCGEVDLTSLTGDEPDPAPEAPAPAPAGNPAPATDESAPAADESAPAADESSPATDESSPTADESAPAADESAPTTDETAPATDDVTPTAEEPAADTGVAAPAMEDPASVEAPAAEEPAPFTDGEQAVAGPATGIALSHGAITIGVKETFQLAAAGSPAGSTLGAVTWRSDNEASVKVDGNGLVTGVKTGSAIVYAQMEGGAEAACAVTVLKAPKKLIVTPKKLKLASDGMTAQVSFSVPAGCASNSFTFTSSNEKVAVVDGNGLVTTVGPGKATISVKAYNGKGGKCKVTVTPAPRTIELQFGQLSIAVGQTVKLEPKVTLSNGKTGKDVAVSFSVGADSRDPDCVSVNVATGEVTGMRKGSAVVVASTYNGKTVALPVTVAAGPVDIGLSEHAVTLGTKETYDGLLANVIAPEGETECASTLAWTTSNKKVATVDANGVITAKKKGSCVITATTVNGLTDTCTVTVYKAPKKVSLSPAAATLKVGETGQYKVNFPNGTGGTVQFTTSDPGIATIDDNGVVTAVSPGEVTITVTTFNGKKATAKLSVSSSNANLPDNGYESTTDEFRENMTNAEKLEHVIYKAQKQLGKKYTYGSGYTDSADPDGFDCSGLVYWCFRQIKVRVKDTAYKQGYDDNLQKIVSISDLRRGDIVCFNTNLNDKDLSDHTGIYIGGGLFIHASSSAKKVIKSDLSTGYYNERFSWGRRVLQ